MADPKNDPTDGMTASQKLMAGIGMGMVSAAQFVGNKVGLVSDDTIAERKKLDQALLNTKEGQIGNAVGVAAAAVGVAAAGAIAVQSGAAATVGNAALRAGQAAVRLPVQKVQKFVETTKNVASAVKNAPQTVVSAAKTARQTAAIAREMPLEAAKTVASAAGRGAFKAANLTTKIGSTILGAQAAISAKEEIGALIDKKEGVSVASVATGAAIVGAAVAGSRLKIAKSAIQSVMSWKGIGLAGTALTSAAVGATASITAIGTDEALSTPIASKIVDGIKEGNLASSIVGGVAISLRDEAEHNPLAALGHEILSTSTTYTTTLGQMDYAREKSIREQQLAEAASVAPQDVAAEQAPESLAAAPARPSAAFSQQAQKPAHLAPVAHAKPVQHNTQAAQPPQTWMDQQQPAAATARPDEAFTREANAISEAVGGVKNLDTLAKALEAMNQQPDGLEPTQLARATLTRRSPQGPA